MKIRARLLWMLLLGPGLALFSQGQTLNPGWYASNSLGLTGSPRPGPSRQGYELELAFEDAVETRRLYKDGQLIETRTWLSEGGGQFRRERTQLEGGRREERLYDAQGRLLDEQIFEGGQLTQRVIQSWREDRLVQVQVQDGAGTVLERRQYQSHPTGALRRVELPLAESEFRWNWEGGLNRREWFRREALRWEWRPGAAGADLSQRSWAGSEPGPSRRWETRKGQRVQVETLAAGERWERWPDAQGRWVREERFQNERVMELSLSQYEGSRQNFSVRERWTPGLREDWIRRFFTPEQGAEEEELRYRRNGVLTEISYFTGGQLVRREMYQNGQKTAESFWRDGLKVRDVFYRGAQVLRTVDHGR